MPDDMIAPLGHNQPDPIALLVDGLEAENHALLLRKDELLGSVGRVPAIDCDEVAGKVAELIKMIGAVHKAAEAARTARKEPYLAAGRAVDGFFKTKITEPLDKAQAGVRRGLEGYLRDKAARERREREEREAEARRQAEAAAAAAREAEQALKDERDLKAAIAAQERAEQAAAAAATATKAAEATPAEMSRTRGDYGALGTLRTVWTFADLDRTEIDLEALRPYFATLDIEKAVRGAIKAGARSVRGVRIYQDQQATVR